MNRENDQSQDGSDDAYDEAPTDAPTDADGLDVQRISSLAHIQCTVDEIAARLDVPESLLTGRPDIMALISNEQKRGRTAIRQRQWQMAQDGNVQMLIYLGRVLLGQDVKEETGPQYPFAKRPVDVDRLKTDLARRPRPEQTGRP